MGSLPVSATRALDRQAVGILLAGGALPVEVANQLAASAEPGDELAIATLLKAAEALATSDPGAAADLGQRALELAPRTHPLRGPLVAQTAAALHASGRGEEAKAFADTALRDALPREQEAEVRLSIAGMFALSPDVRAEAARQALALGGLSATLRARHLARLLWNLLGAGRWQDARTHLTEAQAAVRASGDAFAEFTVEFAEGALGYVDGRFGRSLVLIDSATRAGYLTDDHARACVANQWHGELLTVLDRLDESLQILIDGIASSQRDRQAWVLPPLRDLAGKAVAANGPASPCGRRARGTVQLRGRAARGRES